MSGFASIVVIRVRAARVQKIWKVSATRNRVRVVADHGLQCCRHCRRNAFAGCYAREVGRGPLADERVHVHAGR